MTDSKKDKSATPKKKRASKYEAKVSIEAGSFKEALGLFAKAADKKVEKKKAK